MPELRATYRVQLRPGFGFAEAAALVPYLAELGVSHLYTSPICEAEPGSPHGYDVVDHHRVRAELGGEEGLRALWRTLRDHGLGQVVDVVPNHMSIAGDGNAWWADVLRHGRASRYAGYFDVDWEPPDPASRGRVVLPFLDRPLADAVADGVLVLAPRRGTGEPGLAHHDRWWPLRPDGPDRGDVAEVAAAQHYRLVWWRERDRLVNHRRFFEVDDLVGVRVEDPVVFDDVHRLLAEWMDDGLAAAVIDGVRVDHVDGLADPARYLERLRALVGDRWIVAEKILTPHETLPDHWPVAGTTGYDLAALTTRLLVDPEGEVPLRSVAAELTGEAADWPTIVRRAKRELLAGPLRPELERAARARDPHHPDPDALADEVVALDVYRTYEPGTPSEAGVRFAQLSTALAAKAIEDTALYRDPCLLALAEVGADPSMWSCPPEAFHARMRDAARHRPCSMLALSTHDTKRSADVRARLALLAGRHRAWAAAARRWSARARALDPTGLVDATTVLVLLQTLVGTWPIGAARVRAFARKAVREARRHTSWTDPDPVYEAAVDALIVALLGDGWFRTELEQFVGELLPAARVASLAQTTLLLTVPGVPDLYQGEELWRLSLVDPDNRRPVDFDRRRRLLDALRDPTAGVPDGGGPAGDGHGAAKLALVHRLLRLRAERPGAFGPGAAYAPLPTEGPGADRVLAFVRGGTVVVAVPRLEPFPGLGPGDGHRGPVVRVPAGRWVDACTGAVHDGGPVPAAALFASFPVAVLARSERRGS